MWRQNHVRILPLICLTLFAVASSGAEEYALGPDSQRQAGVPEGTVTKYSWTSKVFPGTVRDYWVYVPAEYDQSTPACLMVFQDGSGFVNEKGSWRVPVVFDNLIHKHEMPVTIGVFIDPGVLPVKEPGQRERYNRSLEYDGLGSRYAHLVLDEILPEVAKHYNVSTDPNDRAIAGSSSGGIAAFTVAWSHPEAFHRVLSFIGSYTDLRGGDIYPALIRKSEPKPLRVFLQDGDHDLNIYAGNWYLGNQGMASALKYAGYDVKFVVGTEGHNAKQGGAILPEALRWSWRDYPRKIVASTAGGDRMFVTEISDPDNPWQKIAQGHQFTDGPAVDRSGDVYYTDVPAGKIYKISTAGKVSVFKDHAGQVTGLMFGADGRLYACEDSRREIVSYGLDGSEQILAKGVHSNDLAVSKNGGVYFTNIADHSIGYISPKGETRVVYRGIEFPNGIVLSPDESLLAVDDSKGRWVWSFQVEPDGSLSNGEPFYRLETPDESSATGADGMTFDSLGYLYVTTKLGVQICDQPGRVVAILSKPQPGSLSNISFGSPNMDYLYVTSGDKVYRRRLRRTGVRPGDLIMPPKPQL
ncbi:MAG TPA: SMP-30/gluconolactonase/LRE family protein [Bryobacteraceae bacterium]|nr:SMP-30/gluconolactonase/LRE family protein [Bryobacteraceae bacterium]